MLLTLIASSIFIFLSLTIGSWLAILLDKILGSNGDSLFQTFLLGVTSIGCYLNIWSLFLPVNYFALVTVFVLSISIYKYLKAALEEIKKCFVRIFSSSFAILATPILLVLLVYALLPPQHGDSPGYHFLTIRWNEQYKAVKGLANLHGRLGFNSSFFVSSAAFAFSKVVGHPLYVLNIALVFCYYFWLINKMYFYRTKLWSIVFLFVAIAMFRQLIDSISSPTPDILTTIIISYVFITIAESILTNNKMDERQCFILLLIICFAFTVKLNTFPLSLMGLFVFFQDGLNKNRKLVLLLTTIGSIILIPWLIKNYILSGYFVFPVAATGFFHPDWQVPYAILHFEKLLINNGPKLISQNWEAVDQLSFTQWLPLWISAHSAQGLTFSLVTLVAAILSAVASLLLISRKRDLPLFCLAIINIISISFWLYNSPDYRFGYPYLTNTILLFALFVTKGKLLNPSIKPFAVTLVLIVCMYYIIHGAKILSPFPLSSYLVKPLQGRQYTAKEDLSRFPFIMLNKQVKLYVEDKEHWCNMANLPCYIPFTDSLPATKLALRGNNIAEGFRIIEK